MRATLCLTCLFVLLLGCGKSSEPSRSGDQNSPGAGLQTNQPANAQAGIDAVLQDLTQRARRYGMEKMRAPADLSELVATGYLEQIPEAPAGKRFAIDKKLQVYLADQ
jgi:hypothetical protein